MAIDPLFEDEHIYIIGDRNATASVVNFGGITATGSSKRQPGDRYIPEVGEDLAAARAFRNLADELEARAMALVEEASE